MPGGVALLTMLFTDVEGSTRAAHLLGNRWSEVLSTHGQLIGKAIVAAGGRVEHAEGNGLFATFPDPATGARAAIAAQRALRARAWPDVIGELRVRMGIHIGEAGHVDGHYADLEMHRAARIADAAHGGQVLVSAAVAAALEDVLCEDLGEHRLKDFPEPERLLQLSVDEDRPAERVSGAANARRRGLGRAARAR